MWIAMKKKRKKKGHSLFSSLTKRHHVFTVTTILFGTIVTISSYGRAKREGEGRGGKEREREL